MAKKIKSRNEDEPYITKCVFEVVKANGEWVSTDDISDRTGIPKLSVTITMKCIRELQEYYDMFPFIRINRLKGYAFCPGSLYTGKPKNMVLEYLKHQDDWASSKEISEYFGLGKISVQQYLRENIRNGLVVSRVGCNGGYKYIGGE